MCFMLKFCLGWIKSYVSCSKDEVLEKRAKELQEMEESMEHMRERDRRTKRREIEALELQRKLRNRAIRDDDDNISDGTFDDDFAKLDED